LLIDADTPTSAPATTAMAATHASTNRVRDVRRGGAAW
jgi:hypothetical protein